MSMDIQRDYPPNYAAVVAAFPWVESRKGIIFAWDMTVFNPDDIVVTPSLMAHEEIHSIRQKGDPVAWWDKYLTSPAFRYAEEIPAHIVEYRVVSQGIRRGLRRQYLTDIAGRLAGPLYGNLTTVEMAKRLLKTGASVLQTPQPEGMTA